MQYADLRDPRSHIPMKFEAEGFDQSKQFIIFAPEWNIYFVYKRLASSATHTDSGSFLPFTFLSTFTYQLCNLKKYRLHIYLSFGGWNWEFVSTPPKNATKAISLIAAFRKLHRNLNPFSRICTNIVLILFRASKRPFCSSKPLRSR